MFSYFVLSHLEDISDDGGEESSEAAEGRRLGTGSIILAITWTNSGESPRNVTMSFEKYYYGPNQTSAEK